MSESDGRFAAGNTAAVHHGARSEAQIRPVARTHRRRVLRQLGLRSSDLDPIGKAYIDQVVRLHSKVSLIDSFIAEHGLIREDGTPQPVLSFYCTLENSLRLAVAKLEAHVSVSDRHHPLVDLAEAGRRVRLAAVGDEGA